MPLQTSSSEQAPSSGVLLQPVTGSQASTVHATPSSQSRGVPS